MTEIILWKSVWQVGHGESDGREFQYCIISSINVIRPLAFPSNIQSLCCCFYFIAPQKNYGHHIKSIVGLLSPSFWVFSFKCECVPFSLCCDCEHLNVNSDSHTLPKPKKTWNACIINCYPPCTNQKKTIRKPFARLFFLSLFHHQFVFFPIICCCFFAIHDVMMTPYSISLSSISAWLCAALFSISFSFSPHHRSFINCHWTFNIWFPFILSLSFSLCFHSLSV